MVNLFEELEGRPVVGKGQIPWPLTTEYAIQSKYIVADLKSLPSLDTATDLELLAAAQHCNNLIGFIEQMKIMGFTGYPPVIRDLLGDEFNNRNLLVDLGKAYTKKWANGKSGQHKIGENYFTIYQGKFYYYSCRNGWHEVEPTTIFDIMPKFIKKLSQTSLEISGDHKPTRYEQIYSNWRNAGFSGKLLPTHFATGQTTPENILEETIKKIHALIEQPISFDEIERATADQPDYLEYLIKISCLVGDFAQQRRASNEHSLYLLRDCAMFNEAQILLDLIDGQQTSHDQIYLGRQSLSSKRRDAGHWYAIQELLLLSLQKFPNNFVSFNAEFTQYMKNYENYSPEFADLVHNVAKYLTNHINEAKRSKLTINIIDLGFQGSINMFVKYVLDQYCLQESNKPSQIHMYVVAEWFKGVYKNMYTSNTFSTLTNIEVMARNNLLYEYVPWSLRNGKLLAAYGNKAGQRQADIELSVMAMTILLAKKMDVVSA